MLKELRERRGEIIKRMRELRDIAAAKDEKGAAKGFTDEQRAEFDKLVSERDRIDPDIERLETCEAEDSRSKPVRHTPGPGREDTTDQRKKAEPDEEQRMLALQGWMRFGKDPVTAAHREAAEACGVDLGCNFFDIPLSPTARFRKMQRAFQGPLAGREERALSAVSASAGGTTIPMETLVNALEINMLAYGGMLQVAETIRTATGEPLTLPTVDDTTNSGRQIGESATVTTTDPAFGSTTIPVYKFSSDEVKVPSELLQDSIFDIAGLLGQLLGTRIGRILNTKFTNGTGAATPYGIVPQSAAGLTSAAATVITWAELDRLITSVDPAYRVQGCGFMFHDTIRDYFRRINDSYGRPLWLTEANGADPPTLKSYPWTINQDMQAVTAATGLPVTATKSVLFGKLNSYKIRMAGEMRLYRLVERHRENDQDAFIMFARAGGNLLNAGTNPVKHILQA